MVIDGSKRMPHGHADLWQHAPLPQVLKRVSSNYPPAKISEKYLEKVSLP
jgi:hypothetical protein